MKDKIFGNMEFLESFIEKFEKQQQIMEPLLLAARQLENSGISQYVNLTATMPVQQIGAIGSALARNTYQFDPPLLQRLHDIYDPLGTMLENISAMEGVFGARVQELVQPTLYLPGNSGIYTAASNFASAISSVTAIDTTWMQQVNPWLIDISCFNNTDANFIELSGINTEVSKLIKLEQQTSGLALIGDHFSKITSVATQLVSIGESLFSIAEQWRDPIAPLQFLSNYSCFASQQHTLIQKAASANDNKSVEWRLDLLNATSKFVDRQITWTNDLVADIQEDIDLGAAPILDNEFDLSVIPQYVGYSKRDDKIVDEAFVESTIIHVTEKGKLIVNKARLIQKLCKINENQPLFQNVELYVGSYVTLAGTFCRNEDSLKTVIDALFQMFYLQKDCFSSLVDLNDFECMEQIRALKKGEIPERKREISRLQNTLYDQFLELEDCVIDKLEANTISNQLTVSISTILSEDDWSEETISNNILKALLRIQGNKIFWGKKEDELNDCVRDALSMVYEIKDQTRQGISSNGKDAGEVDLQICRNGLPFAPIEGLKVASIDRSYIKTHIDKVLTCYDPFGCPYIYLIIYTTAKKFTEFWIKFLDYIRVEYKFPYLVKEEIRELQHIYSNSRHAKTILLRNDKEIAVHFYALLVQ